MSEKYSPKIENAAESEHTPEHAQHHEAPSPKTEEANHRHKHQEDIKNIREKIGETSKTSDEASKHQAKEDDQPKASYKHVQAGSQLQSQALKQNLKKIQTHLPAYQRQFSKFIHKPIVEKVSEGVGATAARPSGLLFAGIFSFIASLVVLTICRYYGYEYNYLVGLVSLGGGFVVGLILEAGLKLIKKVRHAS